MIACPNRTPRVSVVVPCHNEQGNLKQLVAEMTQALTAAGEQCYELLLVDDASSDETWVLIQALGGADPRVRGLRFATQCGQSAAMWAGLQNARGDIIVTLDADLQNPPSEIGRFLAAMEGWDCVCGTRVAVRKSGDNWVRRAASKIANSVRNHFTQDNMSDSGCCYRAFRRACVPHLPFFKGAHRFVPALLLMAGFKVTEIPIGHRARGAGATHYSVLGRLVKSLPDLVAVRWMKSRHIRYDIDATVNPPGKD